MISNKTTFTTKKLFKAFVLKKASMAIATTTPRAIV